MFRKLIPLTFAILLAACTANATPIPTPSETELAAEEQAVYAALLREMYDAPFYVLMDTTATDISGIENTDSSLDYISQNAIGLSPETADSFRVRNDAEYLLGAAMDLGTEYVLLSRDGMSAIFSENQSGWEVFYARYPDAPGITTLSQAGFNNTLDQALVYVGTQSHWLAGAGYYVLLEKVDGLWTVTQQVMVWIS